jgi:hypothetical protein
MIEALGSLAAGIGEAVAAIPAVVGEVGGAVSTAMPTAIAAPASLGGEIGAGVSVVAPGVEMSGGYLASGLDSASIFSETVPFSASAASVPEMPLSNAGDIFSDSWTTLAGLPKSLSAVGPAVESPDVFSDLGFKPVSSSIVSVPEMPIGKPIDIFSDSWKTLGEISGPTSVEIPTPQTIGTFGSTEAVSPVFGITSVLEDSIVDSLIPNEASAPEIPVEVSLSENEWLSLVEEPQAAELAQAPVLAGPQILSVEGITDLQAEGLKIIIESPVANDKIQVLAEETVAQNQLAEKVVQLLVEEGVYSEPQARIRVGEIALAKKGLSEDVVREVAMAVQAEVKTAPAAQAISERVRIATQAPANVTDKNQPISNQEPSERRFPTKAAVVDEKAQSNRRRTIRKNILVLFQKARSLGFKKVNSWEITKGLEEKQENKSYLLTQLELSHVSDGSLEEAARSIEALGEFESSESDGSEMLGQIDKILVKNVPVEIANLNSKEVSKEDVKKVLKHVGERTTPS